MGLKHAKQHKSFKWKKSVAVLPSNPSFSREWLLCPPPQYVRIYVCIYSYPFNIYTMWTFNFILLLFLAAARFILLRDFSTFEHLNLIILRMLGIPFVKYHISSNIKKFSNALSGNLQDLECNWTANWVFTAGRVLGLVCGGLEVIHLQKCHQNVSMKSFYSI